MKVLLIDDPKSKHENLALRKISRYHKNKNDKVGYNIDNPDKIYQSKIFNNENHDLRTFQTDNVVIGGAGYDIKSKLPKSIEFLKPDYELKPKMDYSFGFTSRGCMRNCGFCLVREKEGNFKIWQHPQEFYDEGHEKIRLYDNNILCDRKWFREVTDFILERDLKVDFNQGLDIRLMDKDIANRLSQLNIWGTLNFAWDFPRIEEDVRKGIKLLKEYGFNLRKIGFYILTNFNTDHEEDLYRCEVLRTLGANAYVMRFNENGDYFTNKLARWANARQLFWKTKFKNYEGLNEKVEMEIKNMHVYNESQ